LLPYSLIVAAHTDGRSRICIATESPHALCFGNVRVGRDPLALCTSPTLLAGSTR
jgi:hypothetical protein